MPSGSNMRSVVNSRSVCPLTRSTTTARSVKPVFEYRYLEPVGKLSAVWRELMSRTSL